MLPKVPKKKENKMKQQTFDTVNTHGWITRKRIIAIASAIIVIAIALEKQRQ